MLPAVTPGTLGKARPPRVSRDLNRGRKATAMDNWLKFQCHLNRYEQWGDARG